MRLKYILITLQDFIFHKSEIGQNLRTKETPIKNALFAEEVQAHHI